MPLSIKTFIFGGDQDQEKKHDLGSSKLLPPPSNGKNSHNIKTNKPPFVVPPSTSFSTSKKKDDHDKRSSIKSALLRKIGKPSRIAFYRDPESGKYYEKVSFWREMSVAEAESTEKLIHPRIEYWKNKFVQGLDSNDHIAPFPDSEMLMSEKNVMFWLDCTQQKARELLVHDQ